MIKSIFKKVFYNLQINFRDFRLHPPILIYQMGKVGSKTVQRSLENAKIPDPIYHVHHLSDNGIRSAEEYLRKLGSKTLSDLEYSKVLNRKTVREKATVQWRIITLVREPIQREISDFFENVEWYWPELVGEFGKLDERRAVEFLQKQFGEFNELTDYASTWFDRELKSLFEIDVYKFPFNHQEGFTIIRDRNVEVLVLRLEDLDRSFQSAIMKFLRVDSPIPILKSNVGGEKKFSEQYRYVLENIRIPRSVCSMIYSTKYARHFYSEDMRNEFIRKWTRKNEGAANPAGLTLGMRSAVQ